jgi:hypothetical protein
MSIYSYRRHLRFLSHAQRRKWWEQRKYLTPKVVIGLCYVPRNVSSQFAYVKVS